MRGKCRASSVSMAVPGCVCRGRKLELPTVLPIRILQLWRAACPHNLSPNDARQKFASRWRVLEFCFETESFRN